ncbi:MAG: hypothetical protein LBT12_00720 [Oscillospiraceae bacterium]|nr:hypothetical protein [Oscillospiraceae bacterium]
MSSFIKSTKRILRITAAVIIIAPICLGAAFLFVAPAMNSRRAAQIKDMLGEIALPPETELIEAAVWCGNTSGTGNHVEIWAGVLIHSALPEEEVDAFCNPLPDPKTGYNLYTEVWTVSELLASAQRYLSPIGSMVELAALFDRYGEIFTEENADGHYLIYGYYSAVTQWEYGAI